MDRSAALEAAKRAVADRPNQYGKPEQNFERIAALWETHFENTGQIDPDEEGIAISATDVAIMLALVKIARLEADPSHADSWIDLAGYAGCGAEVSGAAAPASDKPAQTSDLVDDVLQQAAADRARYRPGAVNQMPWPPKSNLPEGWFFL